MFWNILNWLRKKQRVRLASRAAELRRFRPFLEVLEQRELLSGNPTVTSISPNSGPTSGGTTVTINGTNLNEVTGVDFGNTSASNFSYNSYSNYITAISPAESAGAVDIVLLTSGFGNSAPTSADQFTFTVSGGGGSSSGSGSTTSSSVTSLSSSANPATPGQAVTFTATVTGVGGGTPTGTVTFEDGSTVLGTATLSTSSSGTQATFTTSSLAAGSHNITAVYNGDSNFQGSSASLTQTIGQVSPTDTFTSLTASADPAAPGQSVTFTATVSSTGGTPTGTVTFEDGSTVLGTGTLGSGVSGSVASFTTSSLAAGFHSIIAVYGGSSAFNGSSSATLREAVQLVSTTTSVSASANPASLGQSATFTATVSGANGGTPTGTVTFMDGTTVLGSATLQAAAAGAQATFTTSSLGLGSHAITVVYSGDSTFAGSTSASLSEMIQKVGTFAALSSSTDPAATGQSVTFTATVSSANGGTPTGTITFEDGSTVLGTATLSATSSGVQATFTTSSLTAGPHTVTAVYSGDGTFAGSSASLVQIVGQSTATSSSTSLVSSTSLAAPGAAVTFTATVSGAGGGTPTGTVTFMDGSTVLGTATLSSSSGTTQAGFTTSSLGVGAHTITAVYGGDNTFTASTSASISMAVQPVGSSIALTSSANPASPGQTITLTATVSGADGGTPTGTVTFLDGSTVLGTVTLSATSSGVQATFSTSSLASGTHSLIAEYGGDSTYAGSSSASLSQAVQLVNTSTSLTSSVDPAPVGQSVTFTATVLGDNGGTPTGTVTFMNGSTVLGTATLSAASSGAQATFTTSAFAVGTNAITAVYGGDSTFAGSTSASADESVQKIVSYTALSSSNASATSGQSVTFTATVVGATGGTPTGTITFQDGSTVLATVNLSAASIGAQATYTTSSLSSGIHVITAVYNGDSTFLGSNGTLAQSVSQSWASSTVTSLSSSANLAAPGQSVMLTAAVYSSGSGTPTGTIAFMDGSTLLGTATLSAATTGAQATFTTAILADGNHSLTAVYSGDSTFSGSTSSALSQMVQQVNTATSLTTSAALTAPGQSVTFTATIVGGDSGSPTGTVTFKDGSTVLGTATLNATTFGAQAVFTTSSLSNGTHSITAVYGGTSYYAGSTSAALSETVQQLSSYTALSSSANPSAASQSVTFTATVVGANGGTPTGTVTFKDGSTVLGTATLTVAATGAQATFTTSSLAGGSHSITAVYSGDSGYTSSTSTALNETIQLLNSLTSVSTSADFTATGQSVTFTATVEGVGISVGTPTGTVTFMEGTTVLGTATLSAGTSGMPGAQATLTTSGLTQGWHSITAVYGGDGTYSGSSGSLSQVIGQSAAASSSTSLSSSAATAAPGQAVTFTATVIGNGGTPTGTVTFLDGTTVLGTASLSPPVLGASGPQATFTISSLASGTHTITAVYGGDAAFSGSASVSIAQTVGLTVTSTSLSSSVDSLTSGQSVTFTATVSGNDGGTPTGTVTFLDGSTVLGTATLSPDVAGGEASFTTTALAAGFHFITAVYGGDSNYAGSTSDSLSQTVQQVGTSSVSSSISLSSSANPAAPGQSVTFTATVSGADGGTPTGSVTFMDGSTILGTASLSATTSGAQAVFTTSSLANGTHSITATYSGDSTYAPSISSSLGENVQQPSSCTLLTTSANPAYPGQSVTFTATVMGMGGTPTGTVTFKNGSTVLGTATLSTGSSGAQATFTASFPNYGTYVISAVYSGDSTFLGSSASLTQGVEIGNPYSTSIYLNSWSSQEQGYGAVVGQPFTLSASVSSSSGTPTGTVVFEDGSTVIGTAVLNATGQANFTTSALSIGNHSIKAIYCGDSTFSGNSSSSMSVTVQQATSSTDLSTSTDTVAPGDAVTFTATVTGAGNVIPTGTVTFMDGSTALGTVTLSPSTMGAQAAFTISTLAAGTHTITAVYNGDNTFAASTSDGLSETVQQDSSSVSLTATANPAVPGQAVTFTATVSSSDDATTDTPTGTVTFEDGTKVLGTAALTPGTSGAEASFTISNLALGSHSILAVYNGDNVFTAGTSNSLTETVQQDISATSLSASSSSPVAGQAVTFTATVSGTYTDGTPTGTVTFMDGSTVLGTTTLSAATSGAQATFTTTSLAKGAHTLTAVYNGDAAFTGSTSASVNVSVGQQGTTTSLSTSSASIASGQAVTFTATVTNNNGSTPTGTVTFLDGSTVLGTSTLSTTSSGIQATFTTSALANGSHAITAIYNGDNNNAGSSASVSQVVGSNTATQSSVDLSSSATSSAPGLSVTLTAAVTGINGSTPTGTVTFLDGNTVLGTTSLSASIGGVQATFTTTSLAAGTQSLTAIYGGDSTFAPSTSASMSQTIQPVGSSISLSSSADPATLGQSLTLTATVSGNDSGTPTGTVTFRDGSTVLGTATLSSTSSGAQATFATSSLAAGNHSLSAVYAGSSTYAGSSSATLSQPVQLNATYVTLTPSTNSPALGQAVTLTAAVDGVNGGTPTGTVMFLDGNIILGTAVLSAVSGGAQATFTTSVLTTGAHSLTAVYSGDSAFAGSTSAIVSATVQQVFSYTALSSSAPAAANGQSVTFTATVIGASGGTPTGTITFEDGGNVLGTVTLSAASSGAQATFTTSSLTSGTHSISAVYSGDSTFVGSSASLLQSVGQTSTTSTTTSLSSSATSAAPGQSVTFTATVTGSNGGTPTGTVTFFDGSTLLGTATLSAVSSGSQATFTTANLATGSHSITAVYGGDSTYASSSSSALSQTVQQISTSTSLTSSAAPAAPGQSVTFTATVSGPNGSTPAGTITFKDGSTILGTATLNATTSGTQAVFTTSSLANGTHSITAVYSGNNQYAGSTSAALSETVQQMGSTGSLFASNVLIAPGQSVTLTATVVGASGGTPTGTVTFKDGSTILGTATLSATNSGMQAVFTTSALSLGSHSITAVYSGDSGYSGSTSAALNETVQLFGTTASLAASDDSIISGQSVTFTATVTGVGAGVALPTGTVTFKDGTTVLGTATLSGTNSGMQAVFTTSALVSGTHTLTAVYGGDSTFAGSTSPVFVETVAVDSTNTTLSSSALAALPGQSVTFTATVTGADDGTPTGTVTFEDGSTVLGTATLSAATSGAQATFTTSTLASGLHSISAVYSGDSTYTGSSSATLGELVEQVGSFAELSSSANPVTAGQAVTFTATISGTAGQAPTGTVTFKDGSTILGTATLSTITADTADLWSAQATFTTSSLATGMHTIQAIYSGDGGYLGSSASLSQNVSSSTLTQSSTTLSSSVTAALPGQAVTFTATVTGSNGGTPTGTVTFMDGSTTLGTATLSAISSGAQATFTISTLANGTHIITAVYSGDSTYAGSTSTALLESIQPASSTTTTLSSSLTNSAPGQAVTLTATVSASGGAAPTGTVTFQDGSTVLGTVTLSPGLSDMPGSSTAQATFTTSGLALGTHSITAVYNGASVFTASTSTAASLTVQQDSSVVSLSSSTDSTQFGQSVILTATVTGSSTATPTGTVTFQDGTTVLGIAVLSATASGAQANFSTSALAIGSHSLTAVYNGDNSFTASQSVALTQTVTQASTTTALSSSAPTVTSGQSVTFTATVTGSNGGTPTGTITFMDGSTVLGTASLSAASSGVQATFTTSTLADGMHTITAVYSGDSTFGASTSDILNQLATDGTTLGSATTLSSPNLQAAPGQVVTFTATVTGVDGGTPTGTVTFEDGSTVLGSAALTAGSSGAQALFNTSALAAGSHSITAVYNGDSNYSGSTSAALSVTIQAGASTSAGSAAPNTSSSAGTTSDSSTLDSSSTDNMSLADLFDGKLYSNSGIPTPLSANPATSSSTNTSTSSTTTSSGKTAATPPQGPLDSSSSNLSLTGTYQRHYTEWGSNASASFYLDVTCTISISPSGQSGTITYTAYLEDDGDVLVDDQNVVAPVSNPTLITDGSPLGYLPTIGEIPGYGTDDFNFDYFAWDQTHERANSSFNGTGTYTAANGASYSLNQNSSKTSSWDSVRASTDSTATYTNQFGDGWNYNFAASDSTANLSKNLSDPPATGTTFLAQVSNTGSDGGFSITTNNLVSGQDGNLANSLWFSGYTGTSGSRYYYNNTATVPGASSGNSDTVSWNANQQSTSNYGGSQFGNLSYSGSSPSGTVTTTANSSGQSSGNSSMTDAYQRNSSSFQGNGTAQLSNSSAQSYNSQATEKQTYSSGTLGVDTTQFSNGNSGSGSLTVSNSDSYTATTPKGTTKGSDFSISSGGGQSQSNASGSLNLLTNTSSGISISSSSSSGWSLASSTANYNASDGSASSEMSTFLFTMGGAFAFSVIAGDFNASGTQTSGTSYNFSMDGGGVIGSTSSQSWTTGNPTFTYEQEVNGNYNDNATTDLSANSDGTANGSIEAHSNSSTTTDTTTRILGTQKFTDGSAFYNNKNHSNDVYTTAFRVDVSLSSGLANGEVVQGVHDHMTWDYKVNVTADTNTANNTVHAKLSGNGNGSTGIDDTVWVFYDNGTPEAAQTFVFTQNGTTAGSVTANGTIKDGNGHTGTWTLTPNANAPGSNAKASTTSSVNDRLTIRMTLGDSGWNETYRRFSINDSSASGAKYHEEDNGLGRGAPQAGFTESYSNKEDLTTASSNTTIQKGTPTNYSFTINESRSQKMTQSSTGSWSNPALGEGGNSNGSSNSTQKDVLNRTGTEVNGQRALSNLDESKSSVRHSEGHGTIWSPVSVNTYNNTTDVIFYEWRHGSTGPGGSGNGSRSFYVSTASWGTSLDKTAPNAQTKSWGSRTPYVYNPPNVDLSWGPNARPASSVEDQLSADFWRDPGVQLVNSGLQWLGARLGGLLQIVGGSITFVFGTGTAFGGGVFTGGLSLIPGVALMGIGVDEILTGIYNVSNPNVQSMSVLGYGFYSGAQALGASDGTAQMMSVLGPMAVTLGLGAWGAMGKVVFYRGTTYFDALETVSNQAVSVNRLKTFQLGRNLDLGMGLYMSRSRATAAIYAERLSGVGGGPGMVRMQLSRFRWLIMRWRYGALDNIPISEGSSLFQSFVPLGSLNYFNQYAQFFFVPLL